MKTLDDSGSIDKVSITNGTSYVRINVLVGDVSVQVRIGQKEMGHHKRSDECPYSTFARDSLQLCRMPHDWTTCNEMVSSLVAFSCPPLEFFDPNPLWPWCSVDGADVKFWSRPA